MAERVDSPAYPCHLVPVPGCPSVVIPMWRQEALADKSWPHPLAEPQFLCEESEIKAFLWPFETDTEPKTLQEIGFELNLSPELMYLFIPSSFSGQFEQDLAEKGKEPIPNLIRLQSSSQVLQFSAVSASEEEPSETLGAAGDGSGMTCGAAEQSERESLGVTKKSVRRRSADDDSWMPEGWVKQVSQRPFKGKFPGYLDKKYYAPGVSRGFRSKVEALRYLEKTNATNQGPIL